MCNLYNVTKGPQAILEFTRAMINDAGNLEPGDIYPDYPAPIVRQVGEARTLTRARWGMPSSRKALLDAASVRAEKLRKKGKEIDAAAFAELLKVEPDKGTTNIRNAASQHWRPFLRPENRCVVPATSFSEYGAVRGPNGRLPLHWFALDATETLFVFAGLWTRWSGVRKAKEGWQDDIDIFGFLTTEPNAVVAPIHAKAMPVILTTPAEIETWLTAPWEDAKSLQRPLPADQLVIVERAKAA
jgi:putative SOS response-associated peptidase YedK